MSYIVRSETACYGCKSCQLICALHLTGSFWPERSGIQVSRNPKTGVVKWSLGESCDRCSREDEPLCVRYCTYHALRRSAELDSKVAEDE